MKKRNVAIINSDEVEQFPRSRKVPWKWICQLAGIGGDNTTINDKIINGNINNNNNNLSVQDGIKV